MSLARKLNLLERLVAEGWDRAEAMEALGIEPAPTNRPEPGSWAEDNLGWDDTPGIPDASGSASGLTPP